MVILLKSLITIAKILRKRFIWVFTETRLQFDSFFTKLNKILLEERNWKMRIWRWDYILWSHYKARIKNNFLEIKSVSLTTLKNGLTQIIWGKMICSELKSRCLDSLNSILIKMRQINMSVWRDKKKQVNLILWKRLEFI